MKHFFIQTEDKKKDRWCVKHRASGHVITPMGPMNSCLKTEALRWARLAERIAPTDDKFEASRLLIQARFPHQWVERSQKYMRAALKNRVKKELGIC